MAQSGAKSRCPLLSPCDPGIRILNSNLWQLNNLNLKEKSEMGLQQEIVTSVTWSAIEAPMESGSSWPTTFTHTVLVSSRHSTNVWQGYWSITPIIPFQCPPVSKSSFLKEPSVEPAALAEERGRRERNIISFLLHSFNFSGTFESLSPIA